jgi:predicted TIM-barrel fold metal-dependent hydrolase
MKKIDMHNHVVKRKGPNRLGTNSTFVTPEELFEMHDRINVSKGLILPLINVECAYQNQSNEEVIELVERYPDRIAWFCNIDPRAISNSEDANLSHLLLYYKEHGARGVGEVCANLYFDDPFFLNFFEHCERCDMPVTFHIAPKQGRNYGIVDEFGLPRLEKVLKMFTRLKFFGHSQCFWSGISADVNENTWTGYPTGKVIPGRVVELMRKYPNLYGDMSAGSGYNAITRDPEFGYAFLEEFQDRLFFATDICAPENDKQDFYGFSFWLDEAYNNGKISKEAYEKVSYKNAEKILEG